MIKPILKRPLEYRNVPEDNDEDFYVAITAVIGTQDSTGADLFYFYAASPKRLQRLFEDEGIFWGKDLLIMNKFDSRIIEEEVIKMLEECARETWEEVAQAINRFLFWEYDKR
ncbi:hypothetical protein E8L90_13980 [Brevibacillus antibioticus]|uniref:Uncharacterized protein n=1 Tax=Brevibacillus antibioticus TaxID=2570228 RepID=A0A4U2Y797_9BACL|nr:Imm8 family immunity protein [Brevibacillus antibioticus]TKI56486.1 hypothetical protein E8L90_13980 [Brevibacillus antibioticus]